jgi:hypothetical protein
VPKNLLHEREVAVETLIGCACPGAATEHAGYCKLRWGNMLDHANCAGEDARGARAITVTILAIAALGHYHNLAGLEATENLPMYMGATLYGDSP